MFDALIFSTVNALEFNEVRQDVIRIPEVVGRVREAQAIWDAKAAANLDLVNFIGSDDRTFLSNLRLKNLATAVIQLGLLDRYLKAHSLPKLLLGLSNGDSPLKVASGRLTFEELVQSSGAVSGVRPSPINGLGTLPMLSGIALAEFSVVERTAEGAKILADGQMDIKRLVRDLSIREKVKRVVVIGPGQGHMETLFRETEQAVEVVDSVSLDPILSWFWNKQNNGHTAAAQA